MLDAITDFWKPTRKQQTQENKLDLAALDVGSTIGFGFVPQTILSGKRFTVSRINTYQFDAERLTSFVLKHEQDEVVSMIVADAEGEKYLALSRRISPAERARMFDAAALDEALGKADIKRLATRELDNAWKQWMVGQYKKEIQGLQGKIFVGDYRGLSRLPDEAEGQPFDYTLLVSDNNEYAIEAERYADGRLELYAAIYRRVTDIGEVQHAAKSTEAEEKPSGFFKQPASAPQPATTTAPAAPAISLPAAPSTPAPAVPDVSASAPAAPTPAAPMPAAPKPVTPSAPAASAAIAMPAPEAPKLNEREAAAPVASPETPKPSETESKPMSIFNPLSSTGAAKSESVNGSSQSSAPAVSESATAANLGAAGLSSGQGSLSTASRPKPAPASVETISKAEPRALATSRPAEMENDAIECDLRVANKIIEEAIRNEMRLSDIVRRIIALPVAYPESVQIPVTLSDNDFQLLAIRYGLSASDRQAIKAKIIDEINDFSGNRKA